jgi:hypothetical protein
MVEQVAVNHKVVGSSPTSRVCYGRVTQQIRDMGACWLTIRHCFTSS